MNLSLTLIIVAMTGLISYQAFNNPAIKAKLLFHPASIKNRGEYYRFFTSGFIHGDWMHLLINMYVLFLFGQYIEMAFIKALFGPNIGRLAFIGFYLTAIAIANLPTYFRHQDDYGYGALGASGATSALVFMYILFDPWQWFEFPPLPGIILGIAFLWYSSYMDKRQIDNIGHNAHLWGAVYGLVFMIGASLLFNPSLLEMMIGRLMEGPQPFPGF